MAYSIRKTPDDIAFALVTAWNAKQTAEVASFFHVDITQKTTRTDYKAPTVANDTVTAANATNLATSLVLVNEIKDVIDRHFADSVAHDSATSAAITIADGTDLTTAVALANDLKAKTNLHYTAASVHFNDDSTNTVTNANATDQTTLNTLLNEIKGDINAHVISAPLGAQITLVDA